MLSNLGEGMPSPSCVVCTRNENPLLCLMVAITGVGHASLHPFGGVRWIGNPRGGGGDSAGHRMQPPPSLRTCRPSCQQFVAKGAALRMGRAPKAPGAPWAPKALEGNFMHFAP